MGWLLLLGLAVLAMTPGVPRSTSSSRAARSQAVLESLTPRMQELLLAVLRLSASSLPPGWQIHLTEGYRTAERQAQLYAQGRTRPIELGLPDATKIVTNHDGVESISAHQTGNAVDVVVIDHDGVAIWESTLYRVIGEHAEALGLIWGGRWTSPHDPYHLELREGVRIA